MNSLQPFDPLAPTYDASFTHTAVGRSLRTRVWTRLDQHFQAGDTVLELGCGTGEDALHLAGRGVHVLATDSSAAMLAVTQAKAQGNPLVEVMTLDLQHLTPESGRLALSLAVNSGGAVSDHFDGAFANFGPVNVLADWKPLAGWLAEQVRPGGVVGLGVMGPLCLWEMGWHSLHGDFRTAFRRLDGRASFQAEDLAEPVTIYYPSITRLKRDFAPFFHCAHVEAVGLFLPPSDVYGMVEKRPRLLRLLTALEARFARFAPLAHFADHYWIEFEKPA